MREGLSGPRDSHVALTKCALRSWNPDGQKQLHLGRVPSAQLEPRLCDLGVSVSCREMGSRLLKTCSPITGRVWVGPLQTAGPLALSLESVILISVSGKSMGSFSFPVVLHPVFQFILLPLFFVK